MSASAMPGRLPAARRATPAWCLALAVAGHAALAAALLSRTSEAQWQGSPVRAVQVRLLAPAAPAGRSGEPGPERDGAQAQATHPPAVVAPMPGAAGAATVATAEPVYLPRDVLTVPPKPISPVVIDYPTFDGEADHYTGEFDLFVDDSGGVVRVVSATPGLPGILGHAVRTAFLGAHFAPGEVEGRAVRSRIRIEVTFDSRRPPDSRGPGALSSRR